MIYHQGFTRLSYFANVNVLGFEFSAFYAHLNVVVVFYPSLKYYQTPPLSKMYLLTDDQALGTEPSLDVSL